MTETTLELAPPLKTITPRHSTRGLLATDHVILNHGQVTWTTPELAPPSPNYHTNERTFQLLTDLTCIAALHGGSLVRARTHDISAMVRYPNHWATAALLCRGLQ
ncbi:hypothetical protein TNCV_3974701 [Trichonephila clavipes]|nr:hypothetical protein TNCV_3974701 [Trichonephila clavipes]